MACDYYTYASDHIIIKYDAQHDVAMKNRGRRVSLCERLVWSGLQIYCCNDLLPFRLLTVQPFSVDAHYGKSSKTTTDMVIHTKLDAILLLHVILAYHFKIIICL